MSHQGWIHEVVANYSFPVPVIADKTGLSFGYFYKLEVSQFSPAVSLPSLSSTFARITPFHIASCQCFGRGADSPLSGETVEVVFHSQIRNPDYCILLEINGVLPNKSSICLGWTLLPFVSTQIPRGYNVTLFKGSGAILSLLSQDILHAVLTQKFASAQNTAQTDNNLLVVAGWAGVRLSTRLLQDSGNDKVFSVIVPQNFLVGTNAYIAGIRPQLQLPEITITTPTSTITSPLTTAYEMLSLWPRRIKMAI